MPGQDWDARRLVFAYGQPDDPSEPFVVLVESDQLLKPTWSDDVDPATQLGTFLELRGLDDELRFRAVVPGMFARFLHGHGDAPFDDMTFEVDQLDELEVFTVLVPDRDDVAEIVLLGSPDVVCAPIVALSGIDPNGGVQELARLPWEATPNV